MRADGFGIRALIALCASVNHLELRRCGRRRRGRRPQDFRQHFVLRAEGLQAAVVHDQDTVSTARKCARPMRDDDGDPAARPDAEDGPRQRLFAFGVEVRVWFVQDDQEGIP